MSTTPVRIAILDDHQIVIDGLKLLLENEKQLKVVLENTSGFSMLEELNGTEVDIALIDLVMPEISGYETSLMLHEKYPEVKIIILSMNNDAKTIYDLVERADIKGFLPKSVNKSELLTAIFKVNEGGLYFSDELIEELQSVRDRKAEAEELTLSEREIGVIRLICKGLTNKEIASELFISEFTVSTHRKNIFRKTNTHNVATLIALATRLHLLQ
ncbi:MAG TPA: response regulator transcription factor [Ginsengibacter sp.]|nr:response regulator transcription factor [Ginsengibacter sp.]HRP17370.1 response regulator transcription factor [Ginsengibacter sp.]HRP43466.1 response regulator transcription factor [Ginsengibacter sp.]